jgi:hypothetical protein
VSERVVVLDTNVLPSPRAINGPFWQSVVRLCRIKNIRILLPEVVVHESVNRVREALESATAGLLAAHRKLSKVVDLDPVYLPNASDEAAAWARTLEAEYVVIGTNGEDAREALRREAHRLVPARAGIGSRDTAIWLTCLRVARSGYIVNFVSNNTRDFADERDALHSALEAELGASEVLIYHSSLDAFIDSIAEKSEFPLEVVGSDRTPLVDELFANLPPETVDPVTLLEGDWDLAPLVVRRAFSADGSAIGLLRGSASFRVGGDNALALEFSAWVTVDIESQAVTSVDVSEIVIRETFA